jgi:hypothetical protein
MKCIETARASANSTTSTSCKYQSSPGWHYYTSLCSMLTLLTSPLDDVDPPTAWCPDGDHICWPHSCFVQFADSRQARDAARAFQGKCVWHSGKPRRLYVEREWSLELPVKKNW